MGENAFLSAITRIASQSLPITELIDVAAGLAAGGQAPLARQLYQTWINANPGHPQLYVAYFNCSALESQAGDGAAASESLKRALALNADFLPAYINLGGLIERSGAPDKAVELWQGAAARPLLVSGTTVAYVNTALKQVARVLTDRRQLEAAEEVLRRCLDLDPHQADMIEQYIAARLANCRWPVVTPSERLDRRRLIRGIHPLSLAAYTDDPLLQLGAADRYVRSLHDGPQNPALDRRHAAIDLGHRRLRVGYVSSDLRDHAIGYLMAEFFELHGRSDIEVFAYYCGTPSTSDLTTRIKAAVEHWVDIRDLSDDQAAERIGADGIDILVDVNGHTRDCRTGVFARRPAPIQVNWLGYPGTMGSPFHQYLIADDWIVPEGSEIYYSEKVVRLPCYQPNDRRRVVAQRPTREAAGLPPHAFVFCCFNGTHKIGRYTFDRWLGILARVPGSVLWLLDASEETRRRLGDYAEGKGIARARLVFAPRLHNAHHLARYPLADLFLDTTPYGAHTTASDALWMGVPVLTLSGRSFASRVCGSLVRAAGIPELVCTSAEDYVERAVALAADRATLESYRQRLEANRRTSRLFDTELLVRHIEKLYRDIAADHGANRVPQPDLANLDAYLAAGIEQDHDAEEVQLQSDYRDRYRARLARHHRARPLSPDSRLWTGVDIVLADRPPRPAPSSGPSRQTEPAEGRPVRRGRRGGVGRGSGRAA